MRKRAYGVGLTILIGKGGGGIFDFGFPPSTSVLGFSSPGVATSPRNSFGVIKFAVSGVLVGEDETSCGSVGESELASLVDIVIVLSSRNDMTK